MPNFKLRVEDLPVYLIVGDLGHMLDVSGQPTTALVIIPIVVPQKGVIRKNKGLKSM